MSISTTRFCFLVGVAVIALIFLWKEWGALCAYAPALSTAAPIVPLRRLTTGKVRLNVYTLNTMLLPEPAAPQPARRGKLIGRAVRDMDWDILAMQEVVVPEASAELVAAAKFPWCSAPLVPTERGRMNGGVMVASRRDPDGVRFHVFRSKRRSGGSTFMSFDALIGKGVVHTWWSVGGRRVHVYATHLQSPKDEHHVRVEQIREWHAFIREYGHLQSDIVLLSGDFNMPLDDDAYATELHVHPSTYEPSSERKSWDCWTRTGPEELLDGVLLFLECDPLPLTCALLKIEGSVEDRVEWPRGLTDHRAVRASLVFDA